MRRADIDEQRERFTKIIRYVCGSETPLDVGHLLADELGLRFQVVGQSSDDFDAGSPMHNPFGRLRIGSLKDIAAGN